MSSSFGCITRTIRRRISMSNMENTGRKITIDSLAVLKGYLPPRALGLVVEWGLLHREELLARWRAAENHEELLKIDPLP